MFSLASSWLVTFVIGSPWAKTVTGIVVHGITVLVGQYLQGHCYLQTVHTHTETKEISKAISINQSILCVPQLT